MSLTFLVGLTSWEWPHLETLVPSFPRYTPLAMIARMSSWTLALDLPENCLGSEEHNAIERAEKALTILKKRLSDSRAG
jgi:hypothetical protein